LHRAYQHDVFEVPTPPVGFEVATSGRLDRTTILRSLDELGRRDKKRTVFGSIGHQYKLRPPRPAAEIEAFETRHGIELPQDYRYFITEIGDGGAGP